MADAATAYRDAPVRGGRRAEQGAALLVTLTALALLSSIAAFAVMQARSDLLIGRHTRGGQVAFTVAESGLEAALADLARDARFSRLSAAAGDFFPFTVPPPEYFPAPPYRFTVRVVARDAERVDIVATSSGMGRERARIAATVRRDALPCVPAALGSAAAPPSLLLGPDFRIAAGGGASRVPGIGVGSDAAVAALREQLDPATAAQISGQPAIAAGASGLGPALLAHAAAGQSVQALPAQVAGALGDAFFHAPQSLVAAGASGSGILVVDGDLSIDQGFEFDGIVVVGGDLLVTENSAVRIAGAVLQESPGTALHLRGSGEIRYDEAVLRDLAARFAGLLDRRAIVEGWRDDS